MPFVKCDKYAQHPEESIGKTMNFHGYLVIVVDYFGGDLWRVYHTEQRVLRTLRGDELTTVASR
jgi:hypothetical protein